MLLLAHLWIDINRLYLLLLIQHSSNGDPQLPDDAYDRSLLKVVNWKKVSEDGKELSFIPE